jgi:hypothetical protein
LLNCVSNLPGPAAKVKRVGGGGSTPSRPAPRGEGRRQSLLGAPKQAPGSQRVGVATVIGFFAVGGTILLAVDENRGMAAARA